MNMPVIYLEIHFIFAGELFSIYACVQFDMGSGIITNHIPGIVKLRISPVFSKADFSVPNV